MKDAKVVPGISPIGLPLPPPLRVSRAELPADVKKALLPLMRPDGLGYLLQWFFAWLTIALAIVLAVKVQNVWVSVAVTVFIATRQHLLALLMHEQTHRLGFRSRWGDYFCELFVAYPIMVTLEGYRGVHLAHHVSYFSAEDPDYLRKQGPEWTFPQHWRYFILLIVRDILALNVLSTYRGKSPIKVQSKHNLFSPPEWLRPGYFLALIFLLTCTHTWTLFLLYWVLPLVTVMQGIIRLGAITEHRYNLINPSIEESTPLIELLWWERLLLPNLNFTLHIYHHWFPTIAASRLPAVHRICRHAGLVNESNVFRGYWSFLRFLNEGSGSGARAKESA